MNIIRSFITNIRNTEGRTEFSSLIKIVIKESATVVVIIYSSHKPEALQQISSTVSMKKKSKFSIEKFSQNNETTVLSPEFKEEDNIQVVYANEAFNTSIIGMISNGKETFYKVHYFHWSSIWDEWITTARIK